MANELYYSLGLGCAFFNSHFSRFWIYPSLQIKEWDLLFILICIQVINPLASGINEVKIFKRCSGHTLLRQYFFLIISIQSVSCSDII